MSYFEVIVHFFSGSHLNVRDKFSFVFVPYLIQLALSFYHHYFLDKIVDTPTPSGIYLLTSCTYNTLKYWLNLPHSFDWCVRDT